MFQSTRPRSNISFNFNKTTALRKAHSLPIFYLSLYNKPQRSEIRSKPYSNNMTLFHLTFDFFRRCFFKHRVDESEKPGSPPQDRDRNTKLERNTGTAAEFDPCNDIDTQLHSHAAEKPSWNSIMCRIGLVECNNCARHHRASTNKHDEHQNHATSEVTLSAGLGQTIVIEIVVPARYQDRSYRNVLAPWLNGYPQPLASALALCYGS